MLKWWYQRSLNDSQRKLSSYIHAKFGYYPENISLYETAMRHSSVAKKIQGGIKNSNERLEFLGDAVLDIVVAEYLYVNYPTKAEGELTKMKAKVVNRKILNAFSKQLGMTPLIRKKFKKMEKHQSVLGNAFEALIGAMYLDVGYNKTRLKVLHMLKDFNIEKTIHQVTDFKSRLHEWAQKNKVNLDFRVIHEEQAAGRSRYEIEVYLDDKPCGVGVGKSKKSAEQIAANKAWEAMKEKN